MGVAEVAVAATYQARGPIWDDVNGKVTHTTYYGCNANNAYHGALDIGNGTCSVWNLRAMLVGTLYWNVHGNYTNCVNSPQVPQNYVEAVGYNLYTFGQYHHNNGASSSSKSCDRCVLGLVGATGQAYGAHVHAQNSYNRTAVTAWYNGYVTCPRR
jgi:hypothetical protein